jgi:hypothetical protein
MGMANHSKNLLVGVGGADAINFSHFIGACYGMENMMGRADTPLRLILNYAADHFLNKLPILYVLTVRGRNAATGQLVTRGLFIGTGIQCFNEASKLSLQVNFELLDAECFIFNGPLYKSEHRTDFEVLINKIHECMKKKKKKYYIIGINLDEDKRHKAEDRNYIFHKENLLKVVVAGPNKRIKFFEYPSNSQ